MSKTLPVRANLSFLKKRCKQRLRAARQRRQPIQLAAVQRALAKDYGFSSWRKLKAAIETRIHRQARL